jgi:hypothetical protein
MTAVSIISLVCLIFSATDIRAAETAGTAVTADMEQAAFCPEFRDIEAGPVVFDFTGQARARYENYDGFTLKGYAPGKNDEILLERVRLELSTEIFGAPKIFLQLQDAHPFLTKLEDSEYPESSPIEDTLDIRQLYFEWAEIGRSPLGVKAGRQQIAYGDQRVFGPGNWGNTGRYAWDAAMIKIKSDELWADAWIGKYLQYKSDKWPDRSLEDFITFVTYGGWKKKDFRFDIFYVLKNDTSGMIKGESGEGDLLSHTAGFQTEVRALEMINALGTFIFQTGRYGEDRLRAFGANAKAGITAPFAWKPRLGGQFTWGSGDSDPDDGIHGTFDGVYGGRDIFFYGYLNLFFWANIRDYEIDFSVKPIETFSLFIEYHYFTLDQKRDAWYSTGLKPVRRDNTGQSGSELGHEIDFRFSFAPFECVEFMSGYGRFFPGEFIRNTGPAEKADWYFLQCVYSW